MTTVISTEQVKDLRDQTGLSVMQCKKALEEADGNVEKALVILRKKSSDIAAKKSDRTLGAGAVGVYLHSNGTVAAMVELFSETDFVAKNDEFKNLARDIAMHIAAANPQFLKKEDISESERSIAAEVFQKDVEGKPEDLKEKILAGKLDAYFADKVLLDQPFIKNPDLTIKGLIDSYIQKFGEKIEIGRFSRLAISQ